MSIAKKPIHKSNAFINTLMGTLLILVTAYSDTPINGHRSGLPNQQHWNTLPNSLNNPINVAQQKHNQRARILSSQQQKRKDRPKQADSGNNQNKTFFLTIVIIVIVFFVLGVLCCLACIIRYICIKQRSHSTSAVANSKINHEIIFPAISYPLFLTYVGQPFQTHCVICLQEFAQTKKEDEVKESEPTLQQKLQIQKTLQLSDNLILAKNTIRQQKSDSLQRKPLSQPDIKSLQYIQSLKQTEVEKQKVKFTVCGHLLHSKCLDDWLLRLETCPLCRQQFSFENITAWQKKLDINFSNEFDYFFNGKISKRSNKQINRQQTLAQIQRSLSKNDIQFMKGTQEQNKKRVNLRKHEKKAQLVHAITIFVIVLVTAIILVSAICLGLCIIKSYRKKENASIDFDIVFPAIPYSLFIAEIGWPLQSECVICLQQFHGEINMALEGEQNNIRSSNQRILFTITKQSTHQNQIFKQVQQNKPKFQNKLTKDERIYNLVKLTYCGHLLHSKCLNQLLKRQHSCPICRQVFTPQRTQVWEIKAGFSYEKSYSNFCRKQQKQKKTQKYKTKEQNHKISLLIAKLQIKFRIKTHNKKLVITQCQAGYRNMLFMFIVGL